MIGAQASGDPADGEGKAEIPGRALAWFLSASDVSKGDFSQLGPESQNCSRTRGQNLRKNRNHEQMY